MHGDLNELAIRLADCLRLRSRRVVLAESCTAGLVSAALAQVPGVSEFHCGSAVVYRLETIGSVAAMAIDREVLGLGGKDVYDFVDGYRKTLHDATLEGVNATMKTTMGSAGMVIAVAGDASLAKPLAHFGAVRVVDPTKGFATVSELPMDAKASLEVEGAPVSK